MAFGTGPNSARIALHRPLETPAKTKMSKPVGINLSSPAEGFVENLGVLAFRGPDAARFLHGQLSADVQKLGTGQSTLAGFHNPQGRVIALLDLLRSSDQEFLAVLPRELAAGTAQRMRKVVFRSKVAIDEASDLRVFGVDSGVAPADTSVLAWGTRNLWLVPAERAGGMGQMSTDDFARWARADVAEGLPQVCAATSETFVAQMLNLDLLGAIAFDKGCYTGQEVIARAHYRGRVKRRLQRWHSVAATAPRAGDSVRGSDGRALTVVRAAPAEQGGWELLAVGTFATTAEGAEPAAAIDIAPVVTGPLPLPYSLPD
jgi:folate-binding protein YgfZ